MQKFRFFFLLVGLNAIGITAFSNDGNKWIKAGHEQLMKRDFDQAIIFFNRSIEDYPHQVEAYLKRAKVYMILNKYQEAHDDYQRALLIDPDYVRDRKSGRSSFYSLIEQADRKDLVD